MVYLCTLYVAVAIAALAGAYSTPVDCLTPIRGKTTTMEDIFAEILQASAAYDHEHRVNMVDTLEKANRSKAQESDRDAPGHTVASEAANTNASVCC